MFSIDEELNVTFHPDPATVPAREDLKYFSTRSELGKLLEGQTRPQLAVLWNTFAGTPGFDDLKPVKSFTHSPADAINRIWAALQRLSGDEPAAEVQPEVQPESEPQPEKHTRIDAKAKKRPVAKSKANRKAKRVPKPKAAPQKRDGSKKELLISLVSRKTGASMEELMERLGWQRHTLRGFISTLASKGVLKTRTEKTEGRGTVYYAA